MKNEKSSNEKPTNSSNPSKPTKQASPSETKKSNDRRCGCGE